MAMRYVFLALVLVLFSGIATAQVPVVEFETAWEYEASSNTSLRFKNALGKYYTSEIHPAAGEINTYQLTEIDAATGKATALPETAEQTSRFRTLYILPDHIITRSGPYNTISVIRRSDGAIVGARRLRDRIRDAYIENDVLYLLQTQEKEIVLSRFALPGMVFLGETALPGQSNRPRSHMFAGGRIVRFGADYARGDPHLDVSILSLSGTFIGGDRVEHATKRQRTYGCSASLEAASGRYVVAEHGCGHYLVIDAVNGSVSFELPVYRDALKFQLALSERYLFVRPERRSGRGGVPVPRPITIYDLASGQELARLDLPVGSIMAHDGKLFLTTKARQTLQVSVYGINDAALFDEARMKAEISTAHAEAAAMDDPYRALDRFEKASLASVLDPIPTDWPDSPQIAAHYARLLASNPQTTKEGVSLLRQLLPFAHDVPNIELMLEAAELRQAIFSHDRSIREPALEAAWAPASTRPLLVARLGFTEIGYNFDYDSVRYFQGRAYVPCYDCGASEFIGVQVFDQTTWAQIGMIEILRPDITQQESVSNIAFTDGKLVVTLATRFPAGDEVNYYVFDPITFEKLESYSTGLNGALLQETQPGDGLAACECSRQRRACTILETSVDDEARPTNIDAQAVCDARSSLPHTVMSLETVQRIDELGFFPRHISQTYAVGLADRRTHPANLYEFHRLDGAAPPVRLARPVTGRRILLTQDERRAIIQDASYTSIRYVSFDLETGEDRTLIALPWEAGWVASAHDGRTLFIAYAGSVLAVDMISGAVRDFAYLFDDESGTGSRPASIRSLHADGQTLLVISREHGTAIINLERFYEVSEADTSSTPYAQTARSLHDQ